MKNKTTRNTIISIIVVVIIILGIWIAYHSGSGNQPGSSMPTSTQTTTPTSGTLVFDQSISDGTIKVSYPSSDFALATNAQQISVKTYIPPCDSNFNYCLYYTGTAYQGTNFESAGIRIEKRPDLLTQSACLTTEPPGFTGLTASTTASSNYAISIFPQVGNAAAGNFAIGALYRLAYKGSCYEFETRIGESQYANYPPGSIKEFTPADQAAVQSELNQILNTLLVPVAEPVHFPQT